MKYGWLFAALLLNCVLNGLGMELLPSEEWRNANRKETEVRSSAASEVEIRIVGTMRNHGAYLLQKKLPKNSAYCFSADVSAARPGIAYLSVKLFKGGKESARLTSPLNQVPDGRMQIEFETGDADAVQVLLQPSQIFLGKLGMTHAQLCLERLQMVVEVVLIAAHLVMDAPDLLQMLPRLLLLHFDQPEIGSLQHGISSVSAVLSFCQ